MQLFYDATTPIEFVAMGSVYRYASLCIVCYGAVPIHII